MVTAWATVILVLIGDLAICHLAVYELIVGRYDSFLAPFLWIDALLAIPVASVMLVTTGFWRRYVFWKPAPSESGWSVALSAALAWLVLTGVFALVGGLLFYLHVLERHSMAKGTLLAALWENLGWHFLDSIPALKVPDTIHWNQPSDKLNDTATGVFFLFYKIFVLLPVLSVIAQVVKREDVQKNTTSTTSSPSGPGPLSS